jgi:hypothetical protein
MGKSKKYIMLPLILAVMLLAFVAGCKEKEAAAPTTTPTTATGDFTQAQMHGILVDTITATTNARTYKYDMDMTSDMEATGGTEAGTLNMVMNATGAYDQAGKKMHMTMDINMKIDSPEMDETEQGLAMEMYVLEDTMYIKTDMPFMGEQWLKMPVNAQTSELYDADMVSEQLKMLESPVAIKLLRYEMVDGEDCYVFQVMPDMMKIMQWLEKQRTTGTEFNADKIQNAAEALKNVSYNIWIARDSGLMKKMEGSLLIDLNAEEFGAASGDFDNMNMNMNMGMRLYDYDVPLTIELPEEAKDAVEMPTQQ